METQEKTSRKWKRKAGIDILSPQIVENEKKLLSTKNHSAEDRFCASYMKWEEESWRRREERVRSKGAKQRKLNLLFMENDFFSANLFGKTVQKSRLFFW